jgi:putative ABC transport system substrate-binding protein
VICDGTAGVGQIMGSRCCDPIRLRAFAAHASDASPSRRDRGRAYDYEHALAGTDGARGDALMTSTLGAVQRASLVEGALRHHLPAIGTWRAWAEAGYLMSYGPNMNDMFRTSADYVDKILKGAKPADLPVQQPTKFELIVNLKTAKALGLTIPLSVLGRADEVIE